MRTITLYIEGENLIPSDCLAGQSGEHQDTALTVDLPEEWAGYACTFRFRTANGRNYQTMPLAEPVSFPLPQALMIPGKLLVYLDAQKDTMVHRTSAASLLVEESPDWCRTICLAADPYEGLIDKSLQDFDDAMNELQTQVGDVTQLHDDMTALAGQVSADKDTVKTACADISYKIEDFNDKLDAGAISPDMVSFMDLTKRSENLFDASLPVAVGQVYSETGELSANANYDSPTEYIYAGHVAGHTVYASDSIRTLLEYDGLHQLLAHTLYVNGEAGAKLNENTQYIKITIPAGQADTFVLKADSPVTEYIPYQDIYAFSGDVDITPLVEGNVSESIGCGMNVLSPDIRWDTGILTDTGAINPSYTAYETSGYIPVKPSQVYTIYHWDENRQACILSAIRAYCFYGTGKEFISGWSQGSGLPYQIQTPADCCYLRISVPAANLPKVFLAEGNYKQDAIPGYQEAQRIAPTFLTPAPVFANNLQGKTILGLGDSITRQTGAKPDGSCAPQTTWVWRGSTRESTGAPSLSRSPAPPTGTPWSPGIRTCRMRTWLLSWAAPTTGFTHGRPSGSLPTGPIILFTALCTI